MFSHSDLVAHSCGYCADFEEHNICSYPIQNWSYEGSRDDCLWFHLAKAFFEWIDTTTQIRPAHVNFRKNGGLDVYHVGDGELGSLPSFWMFFECLVRSSGTHCHLYSRVYVLASIISIGRLLWGLTIFVDDSRVVTAFDKRPMALLPGKTSSNATFDTTKAWMSECVSDHPKCSVDSAQTSKTLEGIRFLLIGDKNITLNEDAPPKRYACLSHCWGNGKTLIRTSSQNRSEHIETGILIENLPKTYQDALLVCKELGIDSIWIDSLCIVQDDEDDWREQASRMADVYENAHVTIAAVGARNASEGLFKSTPTLRMGSLLPAYPWLYVRQKFDVPGSRETDLHHRTDDGWPLYKRGWTFQELSLSPRVLHFGPKEVSWSCRERTVCEGEPEGSVNLPRSVLVCPSASRSSLQDLWYEIVEGYSWRTLTFAKDKLPAIAAFASRIRANSIGNRYIAGLWEDTLLFDLLWHRTRGGTAHQVEPGVIPSWSWSSSKCTVEWERWNLDIWQYSTCTQVVQIIYNTRGPLVLGDVVEAALVLQTPIIKARNGFHAHLWECVQDASDQVPALCLFEWDDETEYFEEHSEVLAIPLLARKSGSQIQMQYNALIVRKVGPGVYKRVGVGAICLKLELPEQGPLRESWIRGQCIKQPRAWKFRQMVLNQMMARLNLTPHEWYDRFIEEMGRREKQLIKLI